MSCFILKFWFPRVSVFFTSSYVLRHCDCLPRPNVFHMCFVFPRVFKLLFCHCLYCEVPVCLQFFLGWFSVFSLCLYFVLLSSSAVYYLFILYLFIWGIVLWHLERSGYGKIRFYTEVWFYSLDMWGIYRPSESSKWQCCLFLFGFLVEINGVIFWHSFNGFGHQMVNGVTCTCWFVCCG